MSKTTRKDSPIKPGLRARVNLRWLAFGFLIAAFLALAATGGALAGYQRAINTIKLRHSQQLALTLTEQFFLSDQDISAGRYEVARQRLEYILAKDPGFPGAPQKLDQVRAILFATATPTPTLLPSATGTATPTQTLVPTRDLRPVQELFNQAKAALAGGDWNNAILILSSLRTSDSNYEVAKVDGMFFIALRNLGVDKILKGRDLEGGSYDLALAERFGPLDSKALNARELARLYMYGSAFWEAYPAQAVYYFSQVAAAAPYLTDASNWTAIERLRSSLIQYGDQLAAQESWCDAQTQYEQASTIRADADLNSKIETATLKCSPPTETLTPTATPTPTLTTTPTFGLTPSIPPSLTPTYIPPSLTATIAPSLTPTQVITQIQPSETPTQLVTQTFTPTFEPTLPSETPPSPTVTSEPPTATEEQPSSTPEPPTDTPTATQQPAGTGTLEP